MTSLKSLSQKYITLQTNHAMKVGQRSILDRQFNAARDAKNAAQLQTTLLYKVQALLFNASSEARTIVQSRIESLVTLALSGITGESYGFRMDLSQVAGAWSVAFKVISPLGIELDPLDGCGGGIADIVSMALRIAVLEMHEPTIDGPILLDENFKYLSRDKVRTAVEFIQGLIRKTGRQIILVTHVPELASGADKVLLVEPLDESSTVSDITQEANEANLP